MEQNASEKLKAFFSQFKKLYYKKGETIMRAYDEPRGVFYLKKGYAKLYSLSKNAQELTFIIYRPEDFFPMIWPINNTPVTYYTEALTSVELYQAPRDEFIKFIKNNNDVLFEITKRVLTRFSGVLTRMEYAMFGNARNKVAAIILICVDRFGVKEGKNIFIQVPLTHQDIAELLGLARETISVEMKKLQTEGLIDYEGKHLIVKNLPKLQGESAIGT